MKKSRSVSDKIYKITAFVVLGFFSLSILFLLIWGFINSFKERSDFVFNMFSLPEHWYIDAYTKAWKHLSLKRLQLNGSIVQFDMFAMFSNSLLYAVGCTLIKVYTTCIVAYLCAKYKKFFLAKAVVNIVIITMLVPIVGSLPSQIIVVDKLGLFNTVWSLYLFNFSFLGMNFLIFYGSFSSLPDEYSEAAFIDGASHFHVMLHIMLPLVRSTTNVLMLVSFVGYWNDYQTPLVFWNVKPTIAVGLFDYIHNPLNSSFPEKMAASLITVVPVLALFLIFKDKMMGNMTVGGLKG